MKLAGLKCDFFKATNGFLGRAAPSFVVSLAGSCPECCPGGVDVE